MGSNWGLVVDGILSRRAERKEKRLQAKLQNTCPHAAIEKVGNNYKVVSQYVSPSGTLDWICQQCGDRAYDLSSFRNFLSQADKEVFEYIAKREKAFQKLLKKHGYV